MDLFVVPLLTASAWRPREAGQEMVDYALIIAAVAIIVLMGIFAPDPKIVSMFSTAGASLG